MIASMDLNASPEPEEDEVFPAQQSEEDEVFPAPQSEEDSAQEEHIEYNEHVDQEQSGASVARRVSFCLILSQQDNVLIISLLLAKPVFRL